MLSSLLMGIQTADTIDLVVRCNWSRSSIEYPKPDFNVCGTLSIDLKCTKVELYLSWMGHVEYESKVQNICTCCVRGNWYNCSVSYAQSLDWIINCTVSI